MALRLIEVILQEQDEEDVRALLDEREPLEHWRIALPDGRLLVRILLEAEQSEAVLDLLETRYSGGPGQRVIILPVVATLPRIKPEPEAPKEKSPERVSREELYEDIKNRASCSRVYLAMVVLSTIVAAIGLQQNSVALIIGAMVIAPLLGPNVALALGSTLGDLPLLRSAAFTALAGIGTAIALSAIIGVLWRVDPTLPEVASRTQVGLGDIAVAIASGSAGALAFTAGVPTTMIGVMVAVALLPPLVTFGLLLVGHPQWAVGALSLFLMNLICINLAGVGTFLAQGIRPQSWWEKDRAEKATHIAIALWIGLLAGLGGVILLWRHS
jgi:uncharacterized hydrophobic protein (TIGR00341 family)